jgi:AcrR family transcriptional regulator
MTGRKDQESRAEADDRADVNGRVQRTKQAVLKTTFKLMTEGGLGGVSIDEVSRRSGVAKTSIYRHWPSRSALLLDACSRLGQKPEVPDTGSLKGDLTLLASKLAGQLETARWPTILPSIIDAAERDPDLAKLHAELQAGFSSPYAPVIERAKKRGELTGRSDPADVVAAIMGPLFYRRWFSREPIDEKFVRGVVASVLARLQVKV